MQIKDPKVTLDLGTVNNADLLQELARFELSGFTRELDNYCVLHTRRELGDMKREALRGQIATTVHDFSLLTAIIDFFDNVRHNGKNKVARRTGVHQAD